jgi:hypothetical protein
MVDLQFVTIQQAGDEIWRYFTTTTNFNRGDFLLKLIDETIAISPDGSRQFLVTRRATLRMMVKKPCW